MSSVHWACKKISLESASAQLSAITISRQQVLPDSRPQSLSFLGHVVGKRGALDAAVTGCQKISDIRSRMCRSYKYHCSCS